MPRSHIALLRGINVGGKNKLPMKNLAVMFTDAGCTDVQTYIQSGNVAFNSAAKLARTLPQVISRCIQQDFGLDVPVIIRTAAQLESAISNNPFIKRGANQAGLHIMFLADTPDAKRIKELDPDRSAPDEFIVRGQEIYLYLPNGAARSKLTNQYFDSKLKTVSTIRNWRTALKLLELARTP
jgi:uncharacterized protein (DUF1697 family)